MVALQEGTEDAVYYGVKRKLNGQWLYCIERQSTRVFSGPDDYWFVDCGASYAPVAQNTTLDFSGISGSVTCTAGAAIFTADSVGQVIRANGGVGVITAYTSATSVTANFYYTQTSYIDVVGSNPLPKICEAGKWTLGVPISHIGGLGHLEGEQISILADGNVNTSLTVTNGGVTLPIPASYVIAGVPYKSQLKTLPVDSGDPTIQGKRKKLNKVIFRVETGRGLLGGTSFNELYEVKFAKTNASNLPPDAYSGDWIEQINGTWDTVATVCAEQRNPLPVRILGVIFDLVLGE